MKKKRMETLITMTVMVALLPLTMPHASHAQVIPAPMPMPKVAFPSSYDVFGLMTVSNQMRSCRNEH